MKIIVTGSLGHVGKPLTEILVNAGHNVTVISSSSEKEAAITDLGATPAIGSLHNADFLIDTFTGADAVHCMVPPTYYHDPSLDPIDFYETIGRNYKEAIQQAGVPKITHLSSFGAHLREGTGFIVGSHRVEQILNSLQGVEITHVRPTSFYYNFLSFIPVIKNSGNIYANYGGKDIVRMVSPQDIAQAIADEILSPSSSSIRYVASDERTGDDIAQVLGGAIGKPALKWIVISDEQMLQALLKNGMPDHLAEGLTELNQAQRTGKLAEDYAKNKPALGEVKLEDFAEHFAQAYQGN